MWSSESTAGLRTKPTGTAEEEAPQNGGNDLKRRENHGRAEDGNYPRTSSYYQKPSLGTLISSERHNVCDVTPKLFFIIPPDVFFPRQDEEKLLTAVEEGQNQLLELKNQLLSKKNQVAAARAKLEQKTQRLQDINRLRLSGSYNECV